MRARSWSRGSLPILIVGAACAVPCAAACGDILVLDVPVTGAGAVLLAVEQDARFELIALANPPADPALLPEVLSPSSVGRFRVTALVFEETLAELALREGALELAESDAFFRGRLPEGPRDVFQAVVVQGDGGDFSPIDAAPSDLYERLFSGSALEPCVEQGGCLILDANEALRCRIPCEPPRPAPPEPPALAELTPCPAGWVPRLVETATVCDPWLEQTCQPGELPFPGRGCIEPGRPCPSGDYAEDLPSDRRIIYVDASAPPGDGSLAAPHARFADALATAASGVTIAIAKGTYSATTAPFVDDLEVIGACAAETRIDGDLRIEESSVSLRGLSLEHATIRSDSMVQIREVVFEGARIEPRFIPQESLGVFGRSEVELDDVVFTSSTVNQINVQSSSRLIADNVLMYAPNQNGMFVTSGTQIELSRSAIIADRAGLTWGVRASRGSDVLVQTTAIVAGRALYAVGASLRAEDVAIIGAVGDVREEETHAGVTYYDSFGSVRRVWVDGHSEDGFKSRRSEVTLEDVVLSGVEARSIDLRPGSVLDASRVLIARDSGTAVALTSASEDLLGDIPGETTLRLADATITPPSSGAGTTISSSIDATIRLERVHIGAQPGAAIKMLSRGQVLGEDLDITAAMLGDSVIDLRSGSTVDFTRARLRRGDGRGIFVRTAQDLVSVAPSMFIGRDISIGEAAPARECVEPPCSVGTGVFLDARSRLDLEGFEIVDQPSGGILSIDLSTLRLEDGRIARTGPAITLTAYDEIEHALGVAFESNASLIERAPDP